jgi:hypothetical protein
VFDELQTALDVLSCVEPFDSVAVAEHWVCWPELVSVVDGQLTATEDTVGVTGSQHTGVGVPPQDATTRPIETVRARPPLNRNRHDITNLLYWV